MSGRKDVLGMYVGETESAKFWLSIMNGLRNRGIEDILIACVDVLTGFPQAIEAVFPKTEVQHCIIFDSPARDDGSQKWVDFATTYWNVDCVRKMSFNVFALHYHNWCKRKRYNFSKTKAEEIYRAAKELVPVLPMI